ncbi:MAG: monothiol glutaredoxin, Grx4 family [Pelagibacteraceae bacterium]|jgi:monothiol glutaredoxin|nr:monothiol glutaredoxin, Grx4 family [Pelagibacteraceae bacterium]RZO86568.1 MAG: Grx4 family monothiol glutaredoxin [alpha proteobacterium HIMB114]|tara:strand:- start:1887 stop:2216 length:330 start_codon:yes stop_codon:yes gene_type:complete
MSEINKQLDEIIKNNKVVLFMKGTPDMPQCGFSMAVSNVLKHLEVKFTAINVYEDEEIRNGIKEYSNWPTIPQLYVDEEFVGGCDIIKEMFEKAELQKLFEDKGVEFKK